MRMIKLFLFLLFLLNCTMCKEAKKTSELEKVSVKKPEPLKYADPESLNVRKVVSGKWFYKNEKVNIITNIYTNAEESDFFDLHSPPFHFQFHKNEILFYPVPHIYAIKDVNLNCKKIQCKVTHKTGKILLTLEVVNQNIIRVLEDKGLFDYTLLLEKE